MKKFFLFFITALVLCTSFFYESAYADQTTRPVLIVESYSIKGEISSDKTFELSFDIKNTSATVSTNNIYITISSSGNAILPEYGKANQVYVPSIAPDSTYTGTISLKANKLTDTGVYAVEMSVTYQVGESESVLNTVAVIGLQADIGNRVVLTDLVVFPESVAGRQAYISMRLDNLGDEEVRNAKVIVSGNIDGERLIIDVGSMKAGSTGYADGYIVFLNAGEQAIYAHLEYENRSGNTMISESVGTGANVLEGTTMSAESEMSQGEDEFYTDGNNNDLSVLIIAAILVIVLIAAVSIYIKTKR